METQKKNVSEFNSDVKANSGYKYTTNAPYSSIVSNKRITDATIKYIPTNSLSIIDIGCGGGFPGVPLAIFFPEVKFLLADSIAKKLKVVDAVAEGIGLTNISTRHTRAEEIKNQQFDFAVSRAVAPLKELWTWARPLLRTKNRFPENEHKPGLICLKGGDLAKEIQESGTRPHMIEIKELFPEDFFSEKYLLYVPR